MTHSFDMEQRLVGLTFVADGGVLRAMAPATGNLVPPGILSALHIGSEGDPVRGAIRAPLMTIGPGRRDKKQYNLLHIYMR